MRRTFDSGLCLTEPNPSHVHRSRSKRRYSFALFWAATMLCVCDHLLTYVPWTHMNPLEIAACTLPNLDWMHLHVLCPHSAALTAALRCHHELVAPGPLASRNASVNTPQSCEMLTGLLGVLAGRRALRSSQTRPEQNAKEMCIAKRVYVVVQVH